MRVGDLRLFFALDYLSDKNLKEFSRTYFQLILIYMVFKGGKGLPRKPLPFPP